AALSCSVHRPANPLAIMVASVTSNARRPPRCGAWVASCWLAPPPTRIVEGTLNCAFMFTIPAPFDGALFCNELKPAYCLATENQSSRVREVEEAKPQIDTDF